MSNLREKITDLFKKPEIIEHIKSIEAQVSKGNLSPFYEVCKDHLKGVTEDEFAEAFNGMSEIEIDLEDNDLEMVAGGAITQTDHAGQKYQITM
ncbi:MAG: hypothetical protein FWE05_05090 [Defluviitaleaceae bacterium]|nr:hypothetical protein [Defluviitaleaceae bacterium]